jgi:hypothetical protein
MFDNYLSIVYSSIRFNQLLYRKQYRPIQVLTNYILITC